MAVSNSFKDFIAELLAPLGTVAIKRMFGGAGVTAGGVTFAILDDDVMYLKVDDTSRARFTAEAMGPSTYTSKTGEHALSSYMRLPARLMDEPDELISWARQSVSVAQRAAKEAGKGKKEVKGTVERKQKPSAKEGKGIPKSAKLSKP